MGAAMRTSLFAVALLSNWTIAPGATAQSAQSQIPYCENLDNEYAVDLQIGACTALIQSGDATLFGRTVGFYRRGLAYSRRADYPRAIADLTQAIALNPPEVSASALASTYYYRGAAYANSTPRDFVHAIADFDQAILLNPQFEQAFHDRGAAYYFRHDYARAIADYDQAIRLNPQDAVYLNDRCWARAAWGQQLDQALADCNASLRIANEAGTLDSRGLVHLRRGEWQAAFADYDVAVRGDANLIGSLYGRGIARLRLGQADEGQADIAAAVARDADVATEFAGFGVTP